MRYDSLALLLGSMALAAAAAVGCDDGGDDDDDSSSSSPSTSTSTSSGGTGHCAADVAATTCSTDCAFDPATIDCTTACANVATACGAGGCTDQCTGMESDPQLCSAACEGTKAMHCSNVVFGCYAQSDDCDTVGNCVNDNMDTNL